MDPGPVFYEALLYILHFSWGDTGAELVRFVSIIYPPPYLSTWAFSGSSAGKESTCNAGDLSSIPGLGRSLGEGLEYPLQYSWASLVAQMVKNLLAMAGDLGLIPGLGRSPGGGHSNSCLENLHGQRSLVGYSPRGHKELDMTERLSTSIYLPIYQIISMHPSPIYPSSPYLSTQHLSIYRLSAAAAKPLQSCPTLCDSRDASPPGSSVPGILQARTLEWVAISFSNARK